ncbi:copper chaperone CopZ [Stackebrandtia endophytica]|uniref:Copper chaperone CopZ n=1 Tax=Stackebrandtia endophytica TaxID=1496996 RepID=A0A543AYQ7_9ACTN|nr:heavy-metal-associated domain-containing protein [Stackebrandtia endophytica]TQL77707.1 copper chaperone CopZ [Stackebrandtia endophytica]
MCDTCATDATTATVDLTNEPVIAAYEVSGMTCGHCEGSIREEVGQIEGVTEVTAVAATGRLTIASTGPIDEDAIRAAVDEAGYTLTGPAKS